MKKSCSWYLIVGMGLLAGLSLLILTPAPLRPEGQGCNVAITTPEPGANVGETGNADGTAVVPPKGFLWILSHKVGVTGWWPQGGGPADVRDGKWEVTIFFGQVRDIGSKFEIAAVVVEENDDNKLKKWVHDAPNNGYTPTDFPNSFGGCPVSRVVVIKNSH